MHIKRSWVERRSGARWVTEQVPDPVVQGWLLPNLSEEHSIRIPSLISQAQLPISIISYRPEGLVGTDGVTGIRAGANGCPGVQAAHLGGRASTKIIPQAEFPRTSASP